MVEKKEEILENWSVAQIQDMIIPREWGKKETIYASDSDRCLRGVYYSLIGEEETTPSKPEGIRRMELGNLVEEIQVKKLKRMGIFLDAQTRIFDEEYKVSGRPDGIIISPTQCTSEAKRMIKRKADIYEKIQNNQGNFYKGLDSYRKGEISETNFINGRNELNKWNDELYNEEYEINQKLLEPNPKNSLMLLEIKSINEWGYKYRLKEKKPMESHEKQTMFYFWKLREKYPNLITRILYVQLPYQHLLEFDIEFNQEMIDKMKEIWKYIWDCVETKTLPVAAPSVIINPFNNKPQVNFHAEICNYHIKCTGDPNWLGKAIAEVKGRKEKKVGNI